MNILGIGNAIVDVICKVDEEFLTKNNFPEKYWNKLHLQIIWYGREYCKARECYGTACKICKRCYPNRKKSIINKKA